MFEKPPMGRTTDEALTQDYESREMGDGIRGKVVELRPKVVHYAFEERVRGQGETSMHVAEQQDALPLPGRPLGLTLLRQPP